MMWRDENDDEDEAADKYLFFRTMRDYYIQILTALPGN